MPNTEYKNGSAITELLFSVDSKINYIATRNNSLKTNERLENVPNNPYFTIMNPSNDGINYIGKWKDMEWKMEAKKDGE